MKLVLETPAKKDGPCIVEAPSPDQVRQQVRRVSWRLYQSVKAEVNEQNCLEAYGSRQLGISAACLQNGYRYQARLSGWSKVHIARFFQSYFQRDDQWKEMVEWECEDCGGTTEESESVNPSFSVLRFLMGVCLFLSRLITVPIAGRFRRGSMVMVEENEAEMNRAIGRAIETLPTFFEALADTSGQYSKFALKVKFIDLDGVEHIWLRDIEKNGDTLTGVIDNEPETVSSARFNEKRQIDVSKITDWGYFSDGTGHGFFTTKVLLKNYRKKDRKKIEKYYGWKPSNG